MAKTEGVSEATVRRIWQRHGLKPHLVRTFKLSRDPHFAESFEDVVGLYLDPPEHASCYRSMRRVRSRHSIGPNPGRAFPEDLKNAGKKPPPFRQLPQPLLATTKERVKREKKARWGHFLAAVRGSISHGR